MYFDLVRDSSLNASLIRRSHPFSMILAAVDLTAHQRRRAHSLLRLTALRHRGGVAVFEKKSPQELCLLVAWRGCSETRLPLLGEYP
jgi:hypothetical protein